MAFDPLLINGQDLRRLPIEERRSLMMDALSGSGSYLAAVEAIEGDGATVFAHARRLGVEGSVSKRLGTTYQSGRSRHWLKSKNPDYVRECPPFRSLNFVGAKA